MSWLDRFFGGRKPEDVVASKLRARYDNKKAEERVRAAKRDLEILAERRRVRDAVMAGSEIRCELIQFCENAIPRLAQAAEEGVSTSIRSKPLACSTDQWVKNHFDYRETEYGKLCPSDARKLVRVVSDMAMRQSEYLEFSKACRRQGYMLRFEYVPVIWGIDDFDRTKTYCVCAVLHI